jgi:hypothetical protein
MKKILKLSSIAFLLFAGVACENDDQKIIQGKDAAELLAPVNGATYVLLPENAASEMTTFVWNHAEYTQQTSSNYEVQAAVAGTDFADPISLGTTQGIKFLKLTVEEMNGKMLTAGFTPYSEAELDIRVKSSLGDNQEVVSYSNVITLKITPYSTELPKAYVVGNFLSNGGYGNDWTPSDAVALASQGFGKTDFEGYVYFNQDSFEYKFLPTNTGWTGDFGDNGDFGGILIQEGEVNCVGTGAGYYLVRANTGAITTDNPDGLKYSITPTVWGIVGAATPGGWDNSTELTYNASTKKWTGVVTLTAGEFKFRANNNWSINLGGFDPTKPNTGDEMSYAGPNLSVGAGGTYNVELDLSNPRAYSYSITAQ